MKKLLTLSRSTTLYHAKRKLGTPAHYCSHSYNETYGFNLYLYWNLTSEEMVPILSRYSQSPPRPSKAAASHYALQSTEDDLSFIRLSNWGATAKDHAILAHEALHATTFQFSLRGITISFDNDEPAAYLLQWMMGEMLASLDHYLTGTPA